MRYTLRKFSTQDAPALLRFARINIERLGHLA
jgi:hypothetical protein